MMLLTVYFQCSLQVGDVVLVEDDSVMENEFKLVGLQTLVCFLISCWLPVEINIGEISPCSWSVNRLCLYTRTLFSIELVWHHIDAAKVCNWYNDVNSFHISMLWKPKSSNYLTKNDSYLDFANSQVYTATLLSLFACKTFKYWFLLLIGVEQNYQIGLYC